MTTVLLKCVINYSWKRFLYVCICFFWKKMLTSALTSLVVYMLAELAWHACGFRLAGYGECFGLKCGVKLAVSTNHLPDTCRLLVFFFLLFYFYVGILNFGVVNGWNFNFRQFSFPCNSYLYSHLENCLLSGNAWRVKGWIKRKKRWINAMFYDSYACPVFVNVKKTLK